MINKKKLELYIHIPFCVRKCNYCDFLSAPSDEQTRKEYTDALVRELEGRRTEGEAYEVVSVFIGGGTPSILETSCMERLMETVRECYSLSSKAEITVEVNPGTVDSEKLVRYRLAGINRLSIGLQSALEEELLRIGRIHNYRQFEETYYSARKAGFSNINVDVMSALPGQKTGDYERTLNAVLGLQPPPEHISAYSLIVEEGTVFWELNREGKLDLPDEDSERKMYDLTREKLAQEGYHRYEISNYAREGFECRHNCGYWTRTDYLGFGIGAASLMENRRFSNGRELSAYLKDPMGVREGLQELTREEQMEEFMFLGLRLTIGVRKSRFYQEFGQTMDEVYGAVLVKNIRDGLLEEENGFVRLTDRGVDVSNYVMAQFLF